MTVETTHDFLLEIGSEALPAKSLPKLARAWEVALRTQLDAAGLRFEKMTLYYAPRRIALRVEGLPLSTPDTTQCRQGPKVSQGLDSEGNPSKAVLGFAKSCGVTVDALERIDTPKGEVFAYTLEVKGKASSEILATCLPTVSEQLNIQRMRWGAHAFSYLRPVHWVVALLGEQVIEVTLFGKQAGQISFGHEVHAPDAIVLNTPAEYVERLKAAKVLVEPHARREIIEQQLHAQAQSLQGALVEDEALLAEVINLVEWPVVMCASFDEKFLNLPREVTIMAMASHQKCFAIENAGGHLRAHFLWVSNLESKNPGRVIAGNERVMQARLSDADFFFHADQKIKLIEYAPRLDHVLFQKDLGSLGDKTKRIVALANVMAHTLNVDKKLTERAAQLCKCDLVTDMVGEFPELQGIMGRVYALQAGEDKRVANAIEMHYAPRFAGDGLPTDTLAQVIALADKCDTLAGIFAIGQAPTGEKDPFALRRAALGVARILVAGKLSLDVFEILRAALKPFDIAFDTEQMLEAIYQFIIARFKQWCETQGFDAQTFAAVSAKHPNNIFDFYKRLEAVKAFGQHPAAPALAAANKRVSRLLHKANLSNVELPLINESLLTVEAEINLAKHLSEREKAIQPLLATQSYETVLTQLADLRPDIDTFFDGVMVMCDEPDVRENRLALLANLRALFLEIADISLLPGAASD